MIHLRSLLTAAAVLGGAVAGPLHAQGTTRGVETSALMQQSLQPKGSSALPPWSHLDSLPVRWSTPAPVAQKGAAGDLLRKGSVVLLSGGSPLYKTRDGRAGGWNVVLIGTRQGVALVDLSPHQNADDPGSPVEALKAAGFSQQQVCQHSLGVMHNVAAWRVSLPDRRPAVVIEEYGSSNRGGSSIGLQILHDPALASAAKCE